MADNETKANSWIFWKIWLPRSLIIINNPPKRTYQNIVLWQLQLMTQTSLTITTTSNESHLNIGIQNFVTVNRASKRFYITYFVELQPTSNTFWMILVCTRQNCQILATLDHHVTYHTPTCKYFKVIIKKIITLMIATNNLLN